MTVGYGNGMSGLSNDGEKNGLRMMKNLNKKEIIHLCIYVLNSVR